MNRMSGWGRWGSWLAVAALVAISGCGGSGGNNDQGIVFRANGVFRSITNITDTNITCTEPLTVQSAIADQSFTLHIASVPNFPNRNIADADPCGGSLALENNLSQESINVQEVVITYDVPGASIAIPDNSITFGQNIPPTSSTATTSSGQVNLIFVTLLNQIVNNELMVFLNQNANRLPVTPYSMNVNIVAKGQSDNGTHYTTNEIGYQLTIVP